jgi:hypothetical protein
MGHLESENEFVARRRKKKIMSEFIAILCKSGYRAPTKNKLFIPIKIGLGENEREKNRSEPLEGKKTLQQSVTLFGGLMQISSRSFKWKNIVQKKKKTTPIQFFMRFGSSGEKRERKKERKRERERERESSSKILSAT